MPKLVDFGIAKLEREDAGGKRITEAGRAMGSPAYMSPEPARGHDVDARTDIWSMCVMLYEVLTRKLPFDAESYPALVAAILEQEPKSILEHGCSNLQGADDDISGRSLMCTWIERPPDSLRSCALQSVTATAAVTELPDYDPESIRKPAPAVAAPPSTAARYRLHRYGPGRPRAGCR